MNGIFEPSLICHICAVWFSEVVHKLQRILCKCNNKIFSISALSLTLLAIWALSNGVAFGINLSLQIIREDYHPVNIVFQVLLSYLFLTTDHRGVYFSRTAVPVLTKKYTPLFDHLRRGQHFFQVFLQGSYLICFFYLIRCTS